jgi:predicted nucleic acid-binding protein
MEDLLVFRTHQGRPEGWKRIATWKIWIDGELLLRFDERILPIDAATADAWGRIVAQREGLRRPIGTMDAFIAATAQVHKLTLANSGFCAWIE